MVTEVTQGNHDVVNEVIQGNQNMVNEITQGNHVLTMSQSHKATMS